MSTRESGEYFGVDTNDVNDAGVYYVEINVSQDDGLGGTITLTGSFTLIIEDEGAETDCDPRDYACILT